MPKRVFFLSLVISYLLLVISVPVLADTPTPASTTPTEVPTCDLCGWCNRNADPTPAPPPDWQKCSSCLYENGESREGYYYTVFGCLSTKPEFFANSILKIVFSVSGGIAFLSMLVGSAIVLTSSGNPERLKSGKDIIASSIFGLLLIIFSVFLLRVVGFDILKIPGLG
jgi:hypothetical protein